MLDDLAHFNCLLPRSHTFLLHVLPHLIVVSALLYLTLKIAYPRLKRDASRRETSRLLSIGLLTCCLFYAAEVSSFCYDNEILAMGSRLAAVAALLFAAAAVAPFIRAEVTETTELHRSQERYRALAAASGAVVWSADSAGQFIEPQAPWEEYTGQEWLAARGSGWLLKFHPEDREQLKKVWDSNQTFKERFSLPVQVWSQKHDQYRHSELRAIPQRNQKGEVVEWMGIISDLHEHVLAENNFRLALEAAPNAMIMADPDGKILLVNSEAEELFGYSREELTSMDIEDFVPERFRSRHRGHRLRYLAEPHKRSMGGGKQLFGLRKDGTEIPVEIGLNPIVSGEQVYVIGSIIDISDRKSAEEQERLHAIELERSNRELDQFAHVASHDLRAPLRAIDNLARWIAEDVENVLPETSKRHLAQMQQRVRRMERLLEDLLQYSKVGRLRVDPEEVDLVPLMSEIVELLDPPAGFQVALPNEGVKVVTRKVPLEQVLRNLIQNAIKHHDRQEGRVEVKVVQLEQCLEFTIADDGPGIPPQFHQRIFEMFKTLRPRDEVEGSGMGLAVVKKVIEGLGGNIAVESGEGRGAAFRFQWPMEEPAGHA